MFFFDKKNCLEGMPTLVGISESRRAVERSEAGTPGTLSGNSIQNMKMKMKLQGHAMTFE